MAMPSIWAVALLAVLTGLFSDRALAQLQTLGESVFGELRLKSQSGDATFPDQDAVDSYASETEFLAPVDTGSSSPALPLNRTLP